MNYLVKKGGGGGGGVSGLELLAYLIKASFCSCEILYRGGIWQLIVFRLYSQLKHFFFFTHELDGYYIARETFPTDILTYIRTTSNLKAMF